MLVGRNLKKILRNCYSVFKSNLVLLYKVMYSYFNFFVKELLPWINIHWLTKEFLPFQTLRNVFNIKIIKIVNVGFNSLYKLNNRKATVVLTIMLALLISASLLNYSYLEELNEYTHLIENPLSHVDTVTLVSLLNQMRLTTQTIQKTLVTFGTVLTLKNLMTLVNITNSLIS